MNPTLSSKEIQLFQELHDERLQDAKTFSKPSYRGIWASVVDKYKEKAHFVYELLQNADDARATEAYFQLEQKRLIFRHNGKVGFSVSSEQNMARRGHINAITGVGYSTKDEKKGNTIGKFGVGFKAVFQYTKEPQIYDDKFWFKIEQFIVPTAMDKDFPGRKEGETVFVFPFDHPTEAYQAIRDRLKTLNNPILFLRNLQHVTIKWPGHADIVYTKNVVEKESVENITHELMDVNNNNTKEHIHMFTRSIKVTVDGQTSNQFISVGYFVDNNGDLDVKTERKVFCFFPTAETFHLCCVVHAPFLLVDSRQQLKGDPTNDRLIDSLAKLAAEALVILRDYGKKHKHLLINENLFDIIPQNLFAYDYDSIPAENTFRKYYLAELRSEDLLLARKNRYVSCEEALICHPISLMSLINDDQLNELEHDALSDEEIGDEEYDHEWYFLDENIQKNCGQYYVNRILGQLEVGEFTGKTLAKDITSAFMEKQGFKWAKRLYSHLKKEEVNLWKRSAKTKKELSDTPFCLSPIILTSKDTWTAPYTDNGALNVYLPLASHAEGYNFVSDKYIKDEDCLNFVKELGVKEPDAWNHIQSVVLSGYDEDSIDISKLVDDFEIIYCYLKNLSAEKRTSQVAFIAKSFRILSDGNKCYLPNALYDSEDWLKKYFGNDAHFVNYRYYKKFIDKYSIQDFKNFLYLLGVKRGPEIVNLNNILYYSESKRFNITNYSSGTISEYYLLGFISWKDRDLATSKALWEWLSENVEALENSKEATCSYRYYRDYTATATSKLFEGLLHEPWLINAKNKLVSPKEMSLEDLEANQYKIEYQLIKLLGIEKKTKSLKELGASDTQIKQNELGKKAAALGLDSEEKLREALLALKEKEDRQRSMSSTHNQVDVEEPEREEESAFHGKQRKTNLKEMSASKEEYSQPTVKPELTVDEKVNDVMQKLADEANKKIKVEQQRANLQGIQRYTKQWFSTLLDLEYKGSDAGNDFSRNTLKITFSKFAKEAGSNQVYVLSNPSRNIPVWIEEIDGLNVKFSFFNRDDLTLSFEVANVKDFSLRVKAKASDIEAIDKVNWSRCTKAVVEVNNPVEIVGKLKTAFNGLEVKDDFNFKENLSDNISFIFGPPGTGKTTRLAEIISQKMTLDECRILVLTPTNKACDVLTKRLMETNPSCEWLGRFVATGDEEIEKDGKLIDRTSELWKEDKCCIVSTIARLPYDGFTSFGEDGALKDIDWDFIIVDEASMIPLVQIVFAIYNFVDTKMIIAGDPLQIPPIVKEKAWEGENIYTMIHLDNFENPQTEPIQFNIEKLDTQHRSVTSIGNLYSYYCYDGKLKHDRKDSAIKKLPMGKILAKAVNFVPFRVERYDSIFGPKRLQRSNVHIYSAIFAVEMAAYIASQQKENIRMGIICPYAPQAQLINKLMQQRADIPENVSISVGTIHGFQGDECEIILAVFNPPTGIQADPEKIMLNRQNIINVAISRASDYLFVLLPHPDSYGYDNLIEINKLCGIANKKIGSVNVINADDIEKSMFGSRDYIESNTFVTNHQLANVYTKPAGLYEVRIDDNAVDIQVGDKISGSYKEDLKVESQDKTEDNVEVNAEDKVKDTAGVKDENHMKETSSNKIIEGTSTPADIKDIAAEIRNSNSFKTLDSYLNFFKGYHLDKSEAMDILLDVKESYACYVLLQIAGNPKLCSSLGWEPFNEDDIRSNKKKYQKYPMTEALYPLMFNALREKKIMIKGISTIDIENIKIGEFSIAFKELVDKIKIKKLAPKTKKAKKTKVSYKPYVYRSFDSSNSSKLYDKYEYGLSDW